MSPLITKVNFDTQSEQHSGLNLRLMRCHQEEEQQLHRQMSDDKDTEKSLLVVE